MLFNSLLRLAEDFNLLESEGGSNGNVPIADEDAGENEVINKLDRSVKFDEIDTITFGLETDDGKIVKVYVNAEQAEAFEKALAAKLGEMDDIEEVLNELSKEYEIVDVEWPEDTEGKVKDDEEAPNDGSASLDQRVYGPDRSGDVEDQNDDSKYESLSYGEDLTLTLLESSSSIESRFTTASQLMVYHAIIDLGIPEIALARNPYRVMIIKGIKDVADAVQKNAAMKNSLKSFIKRSFDYEKKAEENVKKDEHEDIKHHGAQSNKKHEDEYLTGIMNKGVKEEMKINEDKVNWSFSVDKEMLTISGAEISMTLDGEETEKLIKGINNHDATVVRDETEEPAKKFVFSPRGSSVMVKKIGSADGYLMVSKDVEDLLAKAVPDRKVEHPAEDGEDIKEGLNHMGEKEYKTYDSWKAACKKCCETYWIDGNKDIAQALVGPKPYKRGETKAIGEWDGEKGSIFKAK
jgi:hypothetical protein